MAINKLITPFVPFEHDIKNINIENYELEERETDTGEIEELIKKLSCKIRIHIPNKKISKNIGFFLYVGKIKNWIKTETSRIDLLMLTYLKSLNDSLKEKNLEATIIFENTFFNKNVIGLSEEEAKKNMAFFKEFHYLFPNIDIIDMEDINKRIPEFIKEFNRIKDEIPIKRDNEVYNMLFYSIPFKSLKEAIEEIKTGKSKERADDTYKRYMAFIEGRKKVKYWDFIITEYGLERGTVSFKSNIVSIDPFIKKIPVAHAVITPNGDEKYLIDLYLDKKIKTRVLFKGEPMFYE